MSIPIIFYHEVFENDTNRDKYALSKAAFMEQMQYLSDNGYECVSLDDLFGKKAAAGGTKKKVVISFDDGHYSDYLISFKVLKSLELKATFFVTAGWVGTKNYVTWKNLSEMSSAGMSIQSHGLTHAFLSALDDEPLRRELHESKKLLEAKLGKAVRFISAPGGFCSAKVRRVAKQLNYMGVCDSSPGIRVKFSSDRKFASFNRFLITRNTTFNDFKSIVEGDRLSISRRKAVYCLKSNVRRLLGSRIYYAIWSTFLKKA